LPNKKKETKRISKKERKLSMLQQLRLLKLSKKKLKLKKK